MDQLNAPKKKRRNPEIWKLSKAAGKRWEKGQSGNLRGRRADELISDTLRGILEDEKYLAAFVRAAYKQSTRGNAKFWEMIADRTEARVQHQLELSGQITDELREAEREEVRALLEAVSLGHSKDKQPGCVVSDLSGMS